MQFKRSTRIVYRRAASEALTEEVPSLRTVLASRSPHLRVRERACWAGMSVDGEWRAVEVSGEQIIEGKVKFFNAARGFGFIYLPDGGEAFVHYSSIQKEGYRTLAEGERVRFEVAEGPKGFQATNVVSLGL